jgi:HEAT repeat protein
MQMLPLKESLRAFDEQHDLAKKEMQLLELTHQHPEAGPALLALAKTTPHTDTRWMAMRGMRDLQYKGGEAFLRRSLADDDSLVRCNAARVIGDLHLQHARKTLLKMFVDETEPRAIEQASLALRELNVTEAATEIRTKISNHTLQNRAWLLQA